MAEWAAARNAKPAPPMTPPSASGTFEPMAAVIGPIAIPITIIASVAGIRAAPAPVTDAAKP